MSATKTGKNSAGKRGSKSDKSNTSPNKAAERYFDALEAGFDGLDLFVQDEKSPLYNHNLLGAVIAFYLGRMRGSLSSWRHLAHFSKSFKISQTESGFPAFQNVLELEKDRRNAEKLLKQMQDEDVIRAEMVDFILTKKQFPHALQETMARRRYLETVNDTSHFGQLVLPRTARVSVNAKTLRPYYFVHWGAFDGVANLPLIYTLVVEDSSDKMIKTLVDKKQGKLADIDIPLPVDGLLNPELANQFDAFCQANSAYSLTLSTIATTLDESFDTLHPKQLRRFVLGPFYHSDITVHGKKIDKILKKVKKPQNQWLLSWTMQEIISKAEKPAKSGLWNSSPARDEFFINTDDLDCARMGVSSFEQHALVPHEAYQAIYAAGENQAVFDNYKVHLVQGDQVLSNFQG